MNIPEPIIRAIHAAVRIHGRKAKTAIRNAWYSGNYSNEGLGDFSGELQDWRNSDGHSQLEKLRLADFAS
jgi:uncharacterized protein YecE (DUF72 family)